MSRTPADRLAAAVGTGLYSGYFPIFPGTAGSLAGVALYLILVGLRIITQHAAIAWLVVIGVVFGLGSICAHRCESLFGHDDKRIVVDEVWGMLVSLFMLPVGWKWILGAFVLFRFLDVVKPTPARRAERLGGGIAIMLDDGVAGLYTNLVLQAVRIWLG